MSAPFDTLSVHKQRFQVSNASLFHLALSSDVCLLTLLCSSIGSLLQLYSGPDAVSVPLEVTVSYGDNMSELITCLFASAPNRSVSEVMKAVQEQLWRNENVNRVAKAVPSLFISAKEDKLGKLRRKSQVHLEKYSMTKIEEQALEEDIELEVEPAEALKYTVSKLDDLVPFMFLKKIGEETPIDWDVKIQTSEQFSKDAALCAIFKPGVVSEISFFSPLGSYRVVDDLQCFPETTLNVDIIFPPMVPPERGDPRLRASSHLKTMWAFASTMAIESCEKLSNLPVNELQWMAAKEYTELLDFNSGLSAAEFYRQTCPLDPDERLVDIFAATIERHHDRRALFSPEEGLSFTYEEFDHLSTQLSHALRNIGVTGGNVSMMLPRSVWMYICIIGILKSGAAYVPIDPEYPADRVAYICSDSESQLLITNSKLKLFAPTIAAHHANNTAVVQSSAEDLDELSEKLRELLPPFSGKVWLLDVLFEGPFKELPTTIFPAPSSPNSLAYIIYTSGSTGRPKGVQLENRNVCALIRAERLLYESTPEDITWQGFSIAFDASVEELWLAWAGGGTLFCATSNMLHSGPALADIWSEHKLSIVSTVPTLLTMLEDENLGSLRILILGGEACHRDLVEKWSKGRRMINTYGPTEATVIATAVDVKITDSIVTIGKPIAHYSSYIVDPTTLRVCPKGVPGELLLGGPGLARGYVKRPDLTEKVFISNPFRRSNSSDPDRLYRTGDLTRWSEHGEIEFMGRIDAQVKLRGYRVELAEIESILLQFKELVLSAVCHVMTVGGAQQLVAFIVPIDSVPDANDMNALPPLLTSQQEQDLKEKLRVRLPPYMVPSIFETLFIIPTLPSGKANRKQLPPPRVRGANNLNVVLMPTNVVTIPHAAPIQRELEKAEARSITETTNTSACLVS